MHRADLNYQCERLFIYFDSSLTRRRSANASLIGQSSSCCFFTIGTILQRISRVAQSVTVPETYLGKSCTPLNTSGRCRRSQRYRLALRLKAQQLPDYQRSSSTPYRDPGLLIPFLAFQTTEHFRLRYPHPFRQDSSFRTTNNI